jgi:hypothetical protein
MISRKINMAELTLISAYQYSLKPLVEAALANQLKLLKAGVRRTDERIMKFEEKYRVLTQEFVNRFENDGFEETLEFAEWIGEYRLLKKLQEKIGILQEVHFVN